MKSENFINLKNKGTMRNKLFVLAALLMLLAGCNSETKDFEALKESNKISEFYEYLGKYTDAPEDHITIVQERLDWLLHDSVSYNNVTSSTDIADKYQYALYYLENFPDGNYTKETQAILDKIKKEDVERIIAERSAERERLEWEGKYGNVLKKIENRYFLMEDDDIMGHDYVYITPPDKNGCGRVVLLRVGLGAGLGYMAYTYTYEIYDESEFHIRLGGTGAPCVLTLYDNLIFMEVTNGSDPFTFDRHILTPEGYQNIVEYINNLRMQVEPHTSWKIGKDGQKVG